MTAWIDHRVAESFGTLPRFFPGASGALLAFAVLFALPDALGSPQVRQQPFDLIVMSGLCIGAATGCAAAVLIRSTWRHVCDAMIPRRRWFRFSLRTLFVVMTVLCLGLGWLWRERNLVMERRRLTDRRAARGTSGRHHQRLGLSSWTPRSNTVLAAMDGRPSVLSDKNRPHQGER